MLQPTNIFNKYKNTPVLWRDDASCPYYYWSLPFTNFYSLSHCVCGEFSDKILSKMGEGMLNVVLFLRVPFCLHPSASC